VLEFGVLGELLVQAETAPVAIPGSRRRALLLRLVVSANQAVPAELLIEDTWDQEPPPGAASTLQSHLSFLRKALGPDRLTHSAGGYVLSVGEAELDAWLFEREYRNGRGALAAGDLEEAARSLEWGLARWRGQALADVNTAAWALPEIARLDETRLAALEAYNETLLGLGRHHDVVANAEAAVAEHPLRERLWAQLMLALYRSGRQADALRAYQRLNAHLREELGLEPSNELVLLEEAIVLQKPDLDWTGSHMNEPARLATTRPPTRLLERIPPPVRLTPEPAAQFVGRQAEQQVLERAWKQAAEGGARLVLIGGEPGIGKTTLASALAASVFAQGAIVLYGRCDEDLGIPYQPWVEAIGHVVRYGPDELFENQVPTRMAELARLAPELADRTGAAVSGTVADESERYLLFGAVVDLLTCCSQLAPTLLVLDDLHWADRPSLQLLRHLISTDTRLRLLVVGTYRDSEIGSGHPLADALAVFHREAGVERIALRGLGDDELMALLERYAGPGLLEGGVLFRNALSEETGGNPFFIGEILRHLAETGAVAPGEGGWWEAQIDLAESGLPVSVREVIGHRVGRLGRSGAQWLSMASVVGREFDLDLLANVVQVDQEDLLDVLETALRAGLLVESDVPGCFSFGHALIEHSLYRDLSSLRRAQAHRAVAEAIEDQCNGDIGARIGELAYHWAHATQLHEPNRAIEYARLAGDRALQQLAPDEAVRWYSDALEMLERQDPMDDQLRAVLLVSLGDAQRQSGNPAHRETLLEGAHLAQGFGDTATLVRAALANNRGIVSSVGKVDQAKIEVLEMALGELAEIGRDRALLLATLCTELAYCEPFERRRALADEALIVARACGDDATIVSVLNKMPMALAVPSFGEQLFVWTAEALTRAEHLDELALFWAASHHHAAAACAGEIAEVDRCLEIAERCRRRLGQPTLDWNHTVHRAARASLSGDFGLAECLANEALRVATESGQPDAAVYYGAQIMQVNAWRGTLGELVPLIEKMAEDNPGLPVYSATLAIAHSEADHVDEARAFLASFASGESALPMDTAWLGGMLCYAAAAADCRDLLSAEALFDQLAPCVNLWSYDGCKTEGPVSLFLGGLATVLDRYEEADRFFSRSAALCERMGAKFYAARTNLMWGVMLAQRQAPGDRARAKDLLTKALTSATTHGYGTVERRAALAFDGLV
jgi:DNA-binding SARP family transcriptional activator/DNA polymerase III delta prime subunit